MHIVTQDDIAAVLQSYKTYRAKIALLNADFLPTAEVEGDVIACPVSSDADSAMRTSGSMTFYPDGSVLDIARSGVLSYNSYFRVSVGIQSQRTGAWLWYPLGTFVLDESSYEISVEGNTLTFTLLDLMARLTGQHGGCLPSQGTRVAMGSDIRDVVISAITSYEEYRAGADGTIATSGTSSFGKFFNVTTEGETVPHDLELSVGASVYDQLSQLKELYPWYEMYFDDVTFHWHKIPMLWNDPLAADDSLLQQTVVSERNAFLFSGVANHAVGYGYNGITATYEYNNADSPFAVSKIGRVVKVYSGEDFDKITTSELLLQRLKYETYLTTQRNDAITLSSLYIPWLDVNQKIEYTPRFCGEKRQYIIKKIDREIGTGIMSIDAIRFYPYYPDF